MEIRSGTTQSARREFLRRTAAVFPALFFVGHGNKALGQSTFQTLRILCGAASGSTPDIVARRVAEQLTGRYAQHVIVDNRPGAAGRVVMNALKMAPADGSTVLLASGTVATVNPHVFVRLGYDPAIDLQPVSLVAEMPLALAVGPAVPENVGTVREFMDWMRRNPKLANVGSPGVGTLPQLLEAMLFGQADVKWEHVAYTGGAPAVTSLLGGQIAAVVLPEGILRQHATTGRVRILATSGMHRSAYLPHVPTFVEQEYGELVVQEWFAVFMPAGVPAATIDTASAAIQTVVSGPALSGAFAEWGIVATSSTPDALSARIVAERSQWERVVRAAGVRIE